MKVTHLHLHNFAGIYAGLGKEDIDLDFTKGSNKIILLKGNNGSGKTSILSALHPYRETMDNRRKPELPDVKEASKVITIVDGEDEYIITHLYGNKNKTYITKNGIELNENGNITSGITAIEENLKVNKDYFSVGRIGSNMNNFINFPVAERKKYVNTFVPNLDPYIETFNNVHQRLLGVNSEIKSLNVDIQRYQGIEAIQNNIDTLESNVSDYTDREYSLKNRNTAIDNELKELNSNLDMSIPGLDEEINEINVDNYIDGLNYKVEKAEDDFLKASETLKDNPLKIEMSESDARLEISKAENLRDSNMSELKSRKIQYTSMNDKVKSIDEDLYSNNLKLNTLGKSKSVENSKAYDKVKSQLDDITKERDDYLSQIKYDKFDEDKFSKKFIEYEKEYLETLRDLTDKMESTISDTLLNNLNEHGIEWLKAQPDKLDKELTKLQYESDSFEKDFSQLETSDDLMHALEIHDDTCEYGDNCPFKKFLFSSSSEWSTFNDLEKLVTDYRDKITSKKKELSDMIEDGREFFEVYEELLSQLNHGSESVINDVKYRLYNDFKGEIWETTVNKIPFESVKQELSNEEGYLSAQSSVDSLTESLERHRLLRDTEIKENNQREELLAEEAKLNSSKSEIENQIQEFLNSSSEYSDLYNEYKKQSDTMNSMLEYLIDFHANEKVLNETLDIVKSHRESLDKIQSLENELASNTKSLNEDVLPALDKVKGMLDKNKQDYGVLRSSLDKMDSLQKSANYLDIVAKAVDPKRGIPLVFTNLYLDKIRHSANKLLDIAYDGDFMVDFELNDKSFSIPVIKSDGTKLNDVLEASQGELSMTNLSISLSLLEEISNGYNILYLDEVDGTLSIQNRQRFLQMLNAQVDALGLEQVFVISHSSSYEGSDVDLILLKDNGFDMSPENLAGKNVIYDYYKDTEE